MRTKYITIGQKLILILPLLLISCDDFLKRSAQNLVIPTTTAQYKEILQGEGYFYDLVKNTTGKCGYAYLQYMTDDMEYVDVLTSPDLPAGWENSKIGEDDNVEVYAACYKWDAQLEQMQFYDEVYMYLYKQILAANVCLIAVDESEGTQSEKEILKGQAAFTRAFAYFMLANMYAKPYNKAAPNDLCVPIKPDPKPTLDRFPRATIAEVWNLIASDIQTALDGMRGKNLERNVYEINYPAALILATRIAVFMEDWDKAAALGEEYLASYPSCRLYSITDKTTAGARVENESLELIREMKFFNKQNTEIVWVFGSLTSNYSNVFTPNTIIDIYGKYFAVTSRGKNNLKDVYEDGDRRWNYWFYETVPFSTTPFYRYDYLTAKVDSRVKTEVLYGSQCFRTGEIYLLLAEAYARRSAPDKEKAVKMLNELRIKRFDPAKYKPLQAGDFTNESLVDFVWQERRRELCFEEMHRWWDLRRMPLQQPILHPWRNGETYTLPPDDPAYILNFPQEELEYNGDVLVSNYRPNRLPD
ncbi:MAG: RagB/SusD family nutrient uptake outer membrane protein [Dysgonamonadaceae bacterium]|nr:RagB/SusD family nutrient uptake outer membrane protein [Dysgonamonadaceae bacterium]